MKHNQYDTSCLKLTSRPHEDAPRAGKTWMPEETNGLVSMFRHQETLAQIARTLQRTPSAILLKLTALRLLQKRDEGNYQFSYHFTANGRNLLEADKTLTRETEPDMTIAKNIETKVLIAGQDAAAMTDADIFSKIAKLEGEIAKLQSIKANSKKLLGAIDVLKDDVTKLVEYVDNRE